MCGVKIILGYKFERSVHAHYRHAEIDGVDVLLRDVFCNGSAAAHVHLAKLSGLEREKTEQEHAELQKQIDTLTQQNKDQKAAYDKELATVKLTAAVDAELTAAGSKNNIAVRAMLADFLKDAKVVDGKVTSKENGETITLGAKVEAMKKDAATDFMFGDAPKYSGWKPGENGDGGKPGSTKKLSEMSYSELTEYMAKNPDAKLE